MTQKNPADLPEIYDPTWSFYSIRDALKWVSEPQLLGKGDWKSPEWKVRVRKRGEESLRDIEDLVGEIDDWELHNPNIARIFSNVVCSSKVEIVRDKDGKVVTDEDGGPKTIETFTPKWDQPGIIEGPSKASPESFVPGKPDARPSGEISVPYYLGKPDDKGHQQLLIGFVARVRPHVKCLVDAAQFDADQLSSNLFELPRGFARIGDKPKHTALRELNEELNQYDDKPLVARATAIIGRMNCNTAYYCGEIPVVAVELLDDPPLPGDIAWPAAPDVREPTRNGYLMSIDTWFSKAHRDEIPLCGMTAAALFMFQQWQVRELLRSTKTRS